MPTTLEAHSECLLLICIILLIASKHLALPLNTCVLSNKLVELSPSFLFCKLGILMPISLFAVKFC